MELYVYDTGLNALGVLEQITSLIWTRRYQTAGEASLLVPYRADYAALLAEGMLLMRRGTAEAMQIVYQKINQGEKGAETIEARAVALTSWLERRLVLERIQSSGMTGQQIIRQMIAANVTAPAAENRRIPLTGLYPRGDYADAPIADYANAERATVQECAESLLPTAALGLRVLTNPTAKTHLFDIYRGRDLTAGQSANAPCVFSSEFDTLGKHTYTHSTEALKTTAYVYGADSTLTVNDETAGLNRREMAVDAGDVTLSTTDGEGNEVTLSQEQVNNTLLQRGTEALQTAVEERTFEGTVTRATQLQYGVDYDVGDRVTCQNRKWGVALDVRVMEATETFQGNKTELTVTFGEGTPSLNHAIRQMMKGR